MYFNHLSIEEQVQNAEDIRSENLKKNIFHGSEKIVEQPEFGKGRRNNDFGQGFYCSPDIELAKEWAAPAKLGEVGYANKYVLNLEGLNVLNLRTGKYCLLNWLALLLEHRDFEGSTYKGKENKKYILDNFYPDISKADVIIGYRADDSYFEWAKDFLNDVITLEQLEKAMHFGYLGNQIVLISPRSFEHIEFKGADRVSEQWYHNIKQGKEDRAHLMYCELKMSEPDKLDYTATNIREGGITCDDFGISKDVLRSCR